MIVTFAPKSPVLKKYIEFFYVFTSEKPIECSYLAFPHVNSCISFFKGVSVEKKQQQINLFSDHQPESCIEILGKFTRPILVNYKGSFNEIAIVFKPLGANRFINEDLYAVAPSFSQSYQNKEWLSFGNTLFDSEDSIKDLEIFLLAHFNDNSEVYALEKALPFLENVEINYTIAEIAEKSGYGLKSFQRHFLKHMGCSPINYKRIARFRNSLKSKLDTHEMKTLTDFLTKTTILINLIL